MELFDFPNRDDWEKRKKFIENELEAAETGMSYMVSDHSSALHSPRQFYNKGFLIRNCKN